MTEPPPASLTHLHTWRTSHDVRGGGGCLGLHVMTNCLRPGRDFSQSSVRRGAILSDQRSGPRTTLFAAPSFA